MNFKKVLLLVILTISIGAAQAEKIADGYIITLKNDTIQGQIKLQKFKGDAFYKPFNWGMFAISMTLRLKDGAEKEYFPNEIKGFDFDYDDVHYEFRGLKIDTDELQSFTKDDAPAWVFAQMEIQATPVSFFIFRFNADVFHRYKGRASMDNYYKNYYVKMPSGLVKLNRTFKKNELFTILKDDLNLEESFIETVPKKYNLNEIQEVIKSYNEWKKGKH